MSAKCLSEPARSAKMLRTCLRRLFPDTKFSVRSSSYSGGSSITVEYTDGPFYSEVLSIAKLFQYGYFDGMTDTYYYTKALPGFSGAKFVFVERHYSVEYQSKLLPILRANFIPHYRISNPPQFYDYGRDQIEQAELMYYNITKDELEARIQHEAEMVTTLCALSQ